MPEGVVYVGRPTKWGNPFVVGLDGTAEECVSRYRDWVIRYFLLEVRELRGKDLACWCKEGNPCHADVLLELANGV